MDTALLIPVAFVPIIGIIGFLIRHLFAETKTNITNLQDSVHTIREDLIKLSTETKNIIKQLDKMDDR